MGVVSPIKNAVRQAVGSPLARLPRPFGAFGFDDEATPAAIAYLLQASFTGDNQAIANTETIGPTGDGATYEGYTETGTGTAVDTSTGTVSISSNQLAITGDGSALTTTGMTFPGDTTLTRVVGRVIRVNFDPAAATDVGALTLHNSEALSVASRVLAVSWKADGTFGVTPYSPVGTAAITFSTGTYTTAGGALEVVLGGYASDGVPDATGVYGLSVFFDNGTTRVLLISYPALNTTPLYVGLAQQTATEVLLNDLKAPELITAEDTLTPTGYLFDTFTEAADADVQDHTADTSQTWAKVQGHVDDDLRIDATSDFWYLDNWTGPSGVVVATDFGVSNVLISMRTVRPLTTTTFSNAIYVRGSSDLSDCVFITWFRASSAGADNAILIYTRESGVNTLRATLNGITHQATHNIYIKVTSGLIEVWEDGQAKLSYTSTLHNTNTYVGIGADSFSGTGIERDNLYIRPISSTTYDTALESF